MEAVGIASLGLLGLFAVSVVFGMIFGLIRGTKRASFRFVTILVTVLLSFFLAPVVAGTLTTITIGDYTFEEMIINAVYDTPLYDMSQLNAFIIALPHAILSIVAMIVLFIGFRMFTWLIYAIFVWTGVVGRKKHKITGTPLKRGRLGGAIIGLVQGFVIFFFIAIPINGVFGLINRIEDHQPSFATEQVQILNPDVNSLYSVYETLFEVNEEYQSSVIGFISRVTGMQALSRPMLGHLLTVRTDYGDVNLVNDIEEIAKLHIDFLAISAQFSNDYDATDVLAALPAGYFDGMVSVINRAFRINFVAMIFDSMPAVAQFISDQELLIDADGFPAFTLFNNARDGDYDALRANNIAFNEAILEIISSINATTLRDDLVSVVRLVQDLFGRNHLVGEEYFSFAEVLQDVFGNVADLNMLSYVEASAAILGEMIGDDAYASPLTDIFRHLFGLNMFNFDASETLIEVAFGHLLNSDREIDVDFDDMPVFFTEVIMGIVDVIDLVSDIIDVIRDEAQNILDAIEDFTIEDVERLANLLQTITDNPMLGGMANEFIYDIITDQGITPDDFGQEVYDIITDILSDISAGTINWNDRLQDLLDELNV